MWAAIVVLVALFAAAPVVLSHDVYSYVDYGRLGALHGLDPYVRPPSAAPSDPAFALVRWTGTTSAYGPLFTLATYALAALPVGLAVAVLKATEALATLGAVAIVARLAPARGVDPLRAAAFVGLNPLVLVHVVGGAHNDGLAMLLAVVAAAAVLGRREGAGGATFVAAAGVKAVAGLAAPFALLGSCRRRRFLAGALLAALLLAAASLPAFGWHWLHAFALAGQDQGRTSHLSVPSTLARITGVAPGAVRVVAATAYAALLAWLAAWTWRGGDWLRAAAWAEIGLLLATAWLLPWYLLWALPFAALSRDRAAQTLALALTAFQLGARIPL